MEAVCDSKLLAEGFSKWDSGPIHALAVFSKTIKDEGGVKYGIIVEKIEVFHRSSEGDHDYNVYVFLRQKDETVFRVELCECRNRSIQEIELFFDKVWKNMDCGHVIAEHGFT